MTASTEPTVSPEAINAFLERAWPAAQARCLEVSPTHTLIELRTGAGDLRPGGYVSGPAQFAAADVALWFLVAGVLGRMEPMALTSELSLRFLRPAIGTRLFARADLERAGRRTVVGTIRVWTEGNVDRPCATAQGTYMLPA